MAEITKTPEWQSLEKHYKKIKDLHMKDLFENDTDRFESNHILFDDFLFDYSKNRITKETKELLISLSKRSMKIQKESLENNFIQWKGDLEQIDDVCVIGLKF